MVPEIPASQGPVRLASEDEVRPGVCDQGCSDGFVLRLADSYMVLAAYCLTLY